MGDLNEFSAAVQLFLRMYRWRRIDPVPWTPLSKPLSECKVALISSAGFVMPGQEPFDESAPGGDVSCREVPSTAVLDEMKEFHRSKSFDHAGIAQDPNLALPLDRLREMEQSGEIGGLNARHFSFMGSITAPGRFVRDTAEWVASALASDGADVALLVPV